MKVKLTDICRPKQWKTISMSQLFNEGYPVYGANGKIGYYSEYTHEQPTLMITCRGATCGTVNISKPFSYINGNAMALDNIDVEQTDICFLYYCFLFRGFSDVISGSAQPQITRQGLEKIIIDLPEIEKQKQIVEILDISDSLRQKRKQQLTLLDDYLKSVFLNMFGDPLVNNKGLPQKRLGDLGEVVTGNTPSRQKEEYYGDFIEWIKSDNINTPYYILTKAEEYLSESGLEIGRVAPEKSVLVTCIAGSKDCIGNCAISNRKVAFNQQINAFIPSNRIETEFFFSQILICKKLVQKASTEGMKGLVSKSRFLDINILVPAMHEQKKFVEIFHAIVELQNKMRVSLDEMNNHFNALMQRCFG